MPKETITTPITSDYIMRTALSIALDLSSRKIDFETGAVRIIDLVHEVKKSSEVLS